MSDSNELYGRIEAGAPWILLVDDDQNILDTAKDILEEANYVITTASTGKEAIRQLDEKQFNIVVVDFQLPDSTGLELARKVRERNPHTCVILMTGHASLEMAVKAIQEAVYDYMIKPVDPGQLQRTIEKALEKQRLTLENKQLLHDLQDANTRMARLDSLKSKMLTVMSHDLRTPLSSIRGYSELLKSGVKGKLTDVQKKILEIAIQESDHINGLISDLLDLASIDAGRLRLEVRPVKFDEVVNKACAKVKLTSEMKEVPIDVTLGDPSIVVSADINRMTQVLSNLLRGALKYAPRGGRIFLNAAEKEGMLEIRISHGGQGFTPEQVKSLFASGHAEGNGTQQDGFRVGLALAREMVHAHGGEVGAESQGIDKGVTFWVKLPILKDGVQTN